MNEFREITVTPLTLHIGAEINGVDLCKPLTESAVKEIRAALLQWKIVFFRDQKLSHKQHIQFARYFGDPTPAHVVFGGVDEFPEVYSVAKHRAGRAANADVIHSWSGWHTDITAAVNPPFASILRGDVVPPYGGDTLWTNLAKAYQTLSPTMQDFVETLRCIHSYDLDVSGELSKEYLEQLESNNLTAEHPLVTVHPETNERALNVSPGFVKSIVGLSRNESDALLKMLWEHSVRNDFTVRFKWEQGSVAFWDNRSTAHLAPTDIYESDFDRQFYRVTLNGEIPVGVDGSPSKRLSGEPIKPV